MLGALIGDIAGSIYEVKEIQAKKSKQLRTYDEKIQIMKQDIPLFIEDCSYTDDSVLTTAIADSILNNRSYLQTLREYGTRELSLGLDKYGRSRFGKGFTEWLSQEGIGYSFGNGAAMRVSPIGFLCKNCDDVITESYLSSIPSHNHEEAITAAQAVAYTIYLAKHHYDKAIIKEEIEKIFSYDLNFDIEILRKSYTFSSKAINSIPQAIYCFLISDDFENAIRTAISIGGDSDTIACITGAIAEAYYGVPEYLIEQVEPYIPMYIMIVVKQFYETLRRENEKWNQMYVKLLKY